MYPEDTRMPAAAQTSRKKLGHHKHEVFLSETIDTYNVNMAIAPVDVVTFQEYTRRINTNSASRKGKKFLRIFMFFWLILLFSDRDLYFCRYIYNIHSKKFIPLRTSEEGVFEPQKVWKIH